MQLKLEMEKLTIMLEVIYVANAREVHYFLSKQMQWLINNSFSWSSYLKEFKIENSKIILKLFNNPSPSPNSEISFADKHSLCHSWKN